MSLRPKYQGAAIRLLGAVTFLLVSTAVPRAANSPKATVEVLSGVDFVADRPRLDLTLGATAMADLIAIARGVTESDPGVRIRAYRALSLYPEPVTLNTLVNAIAEHRVVPTGIESLYLRAAIESLAIVGHATAVPFLAPLLNQEANQDTRAAAARALAVCGSAAALPALRGRLDVETVVQVRLAISDAIRELTGI